MDENLRKAREALTAIAHSTFEDGWHAAKHMQQIAAQALAATEEQQEPAAEAAPVAPPPPEGCRLLGAGPVLRHSAYRQPLEAFDELCRWSMRQQQWVYGCFGKAANQVYAVRIGSPLDRRLLAHDKETPTPAVS